MIKIETFHKYIKIKQFGDEENQDLLKYKTDDIIIEEKIDGANLRFMIKDGRIIFGSRTQSIGDSTIEIGGNWKRCVEFIKQQLSKCDLELLERRIYYGECCVKHSLGYNWEEIPPFLGFDIFCFSHEKFLAEKNLLFAAMNLPTVPQIRKCKAKEIKDITEDDIPDSEYYSPSNKDKRAEGIVLKNYKRQIFAKLVREKFKEVARETFGQPKKWAENDDERIVLVYCTNARVDKCIFKLVDEGNKLEMKLMEKLPRMVTEDIYEEHWKEICHSQWSVNFKNIRKLINKRCVAILKQVMVNNALNK